MSVLLLIKASLYVVSFLNYSGVIPSPYFISVIRISSSLLSPPRRHIVAYTSFNRHQLIPHLRRLFYSYGVASFYLTSPLCFFFHKIRYTNILCISYVAFILFLVVALSFAFKATTSHLGWRGCYGRCSCLPYPSPLIQLSSPIILFPSDITLVLYTHRKQYSKQSHKGSIM